MSGIQDFNKKYIHRINNILKGQPSYIKGFANSMSNVTLTTKYTYILYAINFVNQLEKPINQLDVDDFSSYIGNMEYKDNGEPITSSYRIAVYSALKRFCKYLSETKHIISENYMLQVNRPKAIENQSTVVKREKGFLTQEEISEYIQTIEDNDIHQYRQVGEDWNKRDLVMVKIFLNTGIRCSALSKLDVSSIDFENKTLIVTDKGNKVKLFDLPDDLLCEIKQWLRIRKTKVKGKETALFISNRRRRMDPVSISNVVNKYSINIEGKHITPHKLRATYGTQLYNETGDIYFVQDCMGHSNPKTTELYIRGEKRNTKKASDIMSRIVG